MMVPLTGAVGLAVDYARISHAHSVLLGAADAAVASAVSESSQTYRNGLVFTAGWTEQEAQQEMLNFFQANVINNVDFAIQTAEAKILAGGGRIEASLNFEVKVPLTFMRTFFGRDDVVVKGVSSALVGSLPYIDFYMLLDNSPSMGLGATVKDIRMLENNTPDNCAFACHISSEDESDDDEKDNYDIAREIEAVLRIDVVSLAAQNLFDKAEEMTVRADQYRMAAYTFGPTASELNLTPVAELSGDLKKGKEEVQKSVNLMSLAYSGEGDDAQSPFDEIFSQLNDAIKTDGGLGSSSKDRQNIVFFVSDGVADHVKSNCTGEIVNDDMRCNEPIDPQICEALKRRNMKVAVLYTTYLPLPRDGHWYWFVRPYDRLISQKMKECATEGLFFEVSPSQGIVEAMEALFKKAIASPPRIIG